jgi:hypothetical protein
MTAPERMPDKLLIKLVDNPSSVCDGMYINAAGGNEYTRTDIHQAALDRIAELEGALKDLADASEDGYGDNFVDGEQYDTFKDAASSARAVLAKGDG